MKRLRIVSLIGLSLICLFATGCEPAEDIDKARHSYKDCLKEYEKQAEENGGNGGFVDPKTFCNEQNA